MSEAGPDGSLANVEASLPDSSAASQPDALDRSEASTPADALAPERGASDARSPSADSGDSSDSTNARDATVSDATAACATGPFVTNPVTVFDVSAPTTPLEGATVKASVCGVSQITNSMGKVSLMIPAGVESYLRLDAPGNIPTLYPVRTLDALQLEGLVIFNDQYKTAYFPDYDASKTEILVMIGSASGATPPCTTYDGVTISVPGHPEAVVTYWKGGIPNEKAVGAVATAATGVATITGIATGTEVVLDLKKPSCTVAFNYPNSSPTPKLPLETGALTFFGPRVGN